MTNPIEDYMKGTKAVPLPPNSQREGELYNESEKAIEGQTESQTKLAIEINKDLEERYERKRRDEAEKELFESNQREEEIEYNSQQELDDLEESTSDYDDNDNYLQDTEFSGTYFEKPDEPNESLGDRIKSKLESFKTSASDAAENISSSFGASFGAANAKYSRFRRGDPIFAVQSPIRRGKNPYARRPSRQNQNLSRPYVGGRFGDFTLGASTENQYYPTNTAQKSRNDTPAMDLYLPSGGAAYEGEFSGRKTFKESRFNDQDNYDPFGFGKRLAGDGFKNTEKFGSSLMGFESDLFGGGAGNDTVFGSIGKKESSGFGLDMIIGNNGGMFNTIDPSPRKTTTKRKPASTRKTAKKATKKPSTKRKASARKQNNGFALP